MQPRTEEWRCQSCLSRPCLSSTQGDSCRCEVAMHYHAFPVDDAAFKTKRICHLAASRLTIALCMIQAMQQASGVTTAPRSPCTSAALHASSAQHQPPHTGVG